MSADLLKMLVALQLVDETTVEDPFTSTNLQQSDSQLPTSPRKCNSRSNDSDPDITDERSTATRPRFNGSNITYEYNDA